MLEWAKPKSNIVIVLKSINWINTIHKFNKQEIHQYELLPLHT